MKIFNEIINYKSNEYDKVSNKHTLLQEGLIDNFTRILKNSLNVKNYVNSITDWINNKFFDNGNYQSDFGLTTSYKKDEYTSNLIKSLFKNNINITVYVYDSKKPGAFTFAYDPEFNTNPIIHKILQIFFVLFRFDAFMLLYYFIDFLIRLVNIQKLPSSEYNLKKVTIDKETKKIIIGLDKVIIYISSAYKSILTDEELKAIMLHEIGHNFCLMETALDYTFQRIFNVVKSVTIVNIITAALGSYLNFNNKYPNFKSESINQVNKFFRFDIFNNNDISNNNSGKLKWLFILVLILLFLGFISNFFARRIEIKADTFAINCGYGKELLSAIKKLNDSELLIRDQGKVISSIKGFNIMDMVIKIMKYPTTILSRLLEIIHIGDHPDIWSREKYIKEKTDDFINSKE